LLNIAQEGIDLNENRTVFVGGGSILLRKYIEKSGMVAKPLFINNIRANVEGYQLLYNNRKTK
jgi:plasmid segregation protein ParM